MSDDRLPFFGDEQGPTDEPGADAPDSADAKAPDETAAAAAPAKPRRGRKRLRDRWLLLTVLGLITAMILGVAGVGAYYTKSALDGMNQVKREPGLIDLSYEGRPAEVPVAEGEKYPPLNIALMGTDQRTTAERGRSDVLMILHISGDRKSAYLISLPRDYWVPIPGHGTAKINAAYSWGGAALSVKTVEQLLNVPIDHTALINFEGFVNVIDSIGGVSVYNNHASTIDGVHFPEGQVELNDGQTALLFVRNRYGLPNHDFDRTQRQRDVIKAVVEKLLSRGVLTSPETFRDAVTSLGSNFTVDEGLTNEKIIELGMQMRITSGSQIRSMMAPWSGYGTSRDGQAYVEVDQAKIKLLAEALRNDTMDTYQR
ncbi:LCP family protein [Propionibacteriaceae bacterium Y1923]|uniref:LCP family protein n=1 Tax=Aestuariimicrobium sp. Y1814 TaxID=3418742 RepID=UPI003C2598CF